MSVMQYFNLLPHNIERIKSDDLKLFKKDFKRDKDTEFTISLEVDAYKYNFPDDSIIQIHLHKGSNEKILDLGTWGNLNQYTDKITFEKQNSKIKYQITVTAPDDYRYIGKSLRCSPVEHRAAKWFDVINDDIGDVVWNYELPSSAESASLAKLILNENIREISKLPYENIMFQSSILPSFFREILKELVLQKFEGIENEESWHKDVFEVCKTIDADGTLRINEKSKPDQYYWVEEMVNKFSRTQNYVDVINEEIRQLMEAEDE